MENSYNKCFEEIESKIKKDGQYTIFFNNPNYKTNCDIKVSKKIIDNYVKNGAKYTPHINTVYFENLACSETVCGFTLSVNKS